MQNLTRMSLQTNTFWTIIFCFFTIALNAQGWVQTYDLSSYDAGPLVASTDDGYLLCGHSYAQANGADNATVSNIFALKTDQLGNELWRNIYRPWNKNNFVTDLVKLDNGHFAITGQETTTGEANKIFVLLIDEAGNSQWYHTIETNANASSQIIQQSTGELMVICSAPTPFGSINTSEYFEAVQLDLEGNETNRITINYTDIAPELYYTRISALEETSNQTLVLGGWGYVEGISNNELIQGLALQIDTLGNIEWSYQQIGISDTQEYMFRELSIAPNGNIALTGIRSDLFPQNAIEEDNRAYTVQLDPNGDLLWETPRSIGSDIANGLLLNSEGFGILATPDNGYVVTGRVENGDEREVLLLKYDQEGNEVWDQTLPFPLQLTYGIHLDHTNDNGFIISGYDTDNFESDNINIMLVKTDSMGQVFTNYVQGTTYEGADCNENTATPLSNVIIQANNNDGSELYFGYSDSNGAYNIALDTGLYNFEFYPPSPYWEIATCNTNNTVSFDEYYQSDSLDFFFEATTDCPFLTVSISTPFLRSCFSNVYTVQYCNDGTTAAENAYIEIAFDEFINIDSSAIAWSNVDPDLNLYTFNLGTVEAGSCASFPIYTNLACNEVILGQTHCVEAHIYPDSLCLPLDPLWDQSNLEVEAFCLGDSIEFRIINQGEDMNYATRSTLMEDNILLSIFDVQLEAMEEITFKFKATGSTYYVEVEQTDGHPYSQRVSAAIEGCGASNFEEYTVGYYTTYPQNDTAPFEDLDCIANIGSYDPNDKAVTPEGLTDQHYIRAEDQLEYRIRFQNTGTDTAYNVVVQDRISEHLDLTTIELGAASHPYTFHILEDRLVEWRFEDIYLPDSNVNEAASNGFFKFTIQQKEGNPDGTLIENEAAIFFDFNPPIITNVTQNRINEEYFEMESECQDFIAMADIRCDVPPYWEFFEVILLFEGGNPGENGYEIVDNITGNTVATAVTGPYYAGMFDNASSFSYTVSVVDHPYCFKVLEQNMLDCRSTEVTLLSFAGEAQTRGNLLKWTTATEKNSSHFNLMQSLDGETFEQIGRVTAAGNSNTRQDYSFLDKTTAETAYYRLDQVDKDGTLEMSKVIAVQRTRVGEANISSYPNPADQFVQLTTNATQASILQVYNPSGRLLQNIAIAKGTQLQTLNTSQWANGIYFYEWQVGEVVRTGKLVVQH